MTIDTTLRFPQLNLAEINAGMNYRSGFRTITPKVAKIILEEKNPQNRKISEVKVTQAEDDLANGRFIANGESIIFGSDGMLLDGQHRLQACVNTGSVLETLCAFGIPPGARFSVDRGKIRTTGDVLQLLGIPNGNNIASIARMVIAYETGDGVSFKRVGEISGARVEEWVSNNMFVLDVFRWAEHYRRSLIGICPSTVISAARIILEPRMGPGIVDYLEQVAGGESISSADAAYIVRRRLFSPKRMSNAKTMEAILRGAVNYISGKSVSRVDILGRFPDLPVKA